MDTYTEDYTSGFTAGYAQKTDWAAHDEVTASPPSTSRTAWLEGFEAAQDCAHPQYYPEIP